MPVPTHAEDPNDLKNNDVSTTIGGEDTIPTGGLDNFIEIRRNGTYLTDKSILIERIMSDRRYKTFLFCRPRRFGKSVNLTMLDAFLNIEHQGNDWFDGMAVSSWVEGLENYRNKFPVIYIDMQNLVATDIRSFDLGIRRMISYIFIRFGFLTESDRLTRKQKTMLEMILKDMDPQPMDLVFLTECLETHYDSPVVVLIDEYDAPIHRTLGTDIFPSMVDAIRNVMTALLKGNSHVSKAVIVGCMQIAKESLFSGLNNLLVSTVYDDKGYGDLFGMTAEEVRMICDEAGHPERFDEIRDYYDGYHIGRAEVFNPYSVMNYFCNDMKLKQYWVGTSTERVFSRLMSVRNEEIRDSIMAIASGERVQVRLNDRLAFPHSGNVEEMEPNDAFDFLIQSGYFTTESTGLDTYEIWIPNEEIRQLFISNLYGWLGGGCRPMNRILEMLLEGRPGDAVEPVMTLFDEMINNRSETLWSSYQLILSGFLADQDTHIVRPEHHSGDGVTDISVIPRGNGPAAVIEFKKTGRGGNPEEDAVRAFKQIHERRYTLGLRGDPILTYGFAVGEHAVVICSEKGTFRADFPA